MKDIYLLPLGNVNAYLLKDPKDKQIVLIDTGAPGSASKIKEAINSIGHQLSDLKAILLTHCHGDHAGSVAVLKREAPQVKIYASKFEAPIVEEGLKQRAMTPSPGIMNKLLFKLFVTDHPIEAVPVDVKLNGGESIDVAGGINVIEIPGHSLGQLAFSLPQLGGIMFVADAASNMPRLGWSIGHEEIITAKQSLKKLANLDFEIACFGHGKPIMTGASQKFRNKWDNK